MRGGSRPGAGRPVGSKDKTPRTEPKTQIWARIPTWMDEWMAGQKETRTDLIESGLL